MQVQRNDELQHLAVVAGKCRLRARDAELLAGKQAMAAVEHLPILMPNDRLADAVLPDVLDQRGKLLGTEQRKDVSGRMKPAVSF